jgi:2-oxoglutarate dehydrogenase complex dehydrogenase (E1) component-like enzyme
MERLVSSVTRPAAGSIRCLPQLILATRGAQKAHRESFLNASSSNYIDEMYEQWSKDPHSVHKVYFQKTLNQKESNENIRISSHGIFIFVIKFINDRQHWVSLHHHQH